ncbi:MAG: MATE family efflux transporter [Christensenellales bacterium]|jgi:putative MATE family efflux protein
MNNTVLNRGSTPLRTVMLLSAPAILEQILLSLAGYVDTAMLGFYGVGATAAVAVSASTMWLVGGLMSATGVGFAFLVARNIGAGKPDVAQSAVKHAIACGGLLGLTLSLLAFTLAPHLPAWLNAAEDVRPNASVYLRIGGSAMLFQTFGAVFSSVIRASGNMRVPMRINMAANAVNVVGNFFLIFETRKLSLFGYEFWVYGAGLGVKGAAIATALCHVTAATFMGIYLLRGNSIIRVRFQKAFRFDRSLLRDAFKIALPAAMERTFMSLGQVCMTAMVTNLGTVQLAAHHLAITAESLSYLPAYGVSTCASTLIGQALGAKREDRAESFGRLIARIGFGIMAIGGIVLFTCADPLIRLFSNDPAVIEEGIRVLRIVAFVEPFFGLSIVLSGALNGAGDAKTVFLIDAFSMWGIRLGTSWFLAYPMGLGLRGAWFGMAADLFVRGILFYLRFRSGKWKRAWKGA